MKKGFLILLILFVSLAIYGQEIPAPAVNTTEVKTPALVAEVKETTAEEKLAFLEAEEAKKEEKAKASKAEEVAKIKTNIRDLKAMMFDMVTEKGALISRINDLDKAIAERTGIVKRFTARLKELMKSE